MKAKTIKQVIRAKVDAWLASIEDESVRALAMGSTIVTGGAIASMLLKEPVNDFDKRWPHSFGQVSEIFK